jgi:prolyl-tRNA editing enzyme YbaK/EbsC (Cys-tRNA(Pro) deacylase)
VEKILVSAGERGVDLQMKVSDIVALTSARLVSLAD